MRTLTGVPEDQLIALLCPSCRKQANGPLMEGGRFVCAKCGWEGHQDQLVEEETDETLDPEEETRETPPIFTAPKSGHPGGELHEPRRAEWPDPTPEQLGSPEFEVIWQTIKRWDINVPNVYHGYMGATGNHVRAILDALDRLKA